MTDYVTIGTLQVARVLRDFVEQEALPGSGLEAARFWSALQDGLVRFTPRNRHLRKQREALQERIDAWHQARPGPPDRSAYQAFLQEIGYLEADVPDFTITTRGLDPEISHVSGPQLVVPVMNARYALNAANARWGSLYDALYGTDVIPESDGAEKGTVYNPRRGAKVVAFAARQLDAFFPLADARHAQVTAYTIVAGELNCRLADDRIATLVRPEQLAGYRGPPQAPTCVLLRNHGLHAELQIDPAHPVGATHPAGLKDILLEAALTTIQDAEDSVAAVDADDKVQVYRNWLGLMKGDLRDTFRKGDRTVTRELQPDRNYLAPDGEPFHLPGRSLLLMRNVGLLMDNTMVCDDNGTPQPEGILDGYITSLIALHDLKGNGRFRNSVAGSVYLVKPKLHGREEVRFTVELFAAIEEALALRPNTLKLGMMDEERRTSLNLKACIEAARERIFFINTGFLDRTGDEIHTSMDAGPMVRKGDMKSQPWLRAYEDHNVATGLACGFRGRAQIGKGMWAMPDEMRRMLEEKIGHPEAGANTAWVPSPTAAVLHALHYHTVDVRAVQAKLEHQPRPPREAMLQIPLLGKERPSAKVVQDELDNNVQGILGYVVRWIELGVGCSKVPDIHDTGLMEDRATLRISSQHIANWLQHGLCSEAQVRQTLENMARKVDAQNAADPFYEPMAADFDRSLAFQAATDLIFKGRKQPNGYTEPLLYHYRLLAKQSA